MRHLFLLAAFTIPILCGLAAPALGQDVDFNCDVRPIFTRHCFKCHGPDDKPRQAGLRLDSRAAAVALLPSGRRAVVPGKPDQSELVRRVLAVGGRAMPPPAANNPLSEAQKQVLRRWVASGAEYRLHWSFVPPRPAPLPKVRNKGWVRNPIDTFILARLEAEGLKPPPRADRYTLGRRVYLDLIGLPPTPEEADAFVNDPAPDAYEKLVDRLLASPHYGERWARRWLDLARYADTNGYEKDRPRSIWPYRDWVIRALNADMPFDQFTIEQIAGDMLPNATSEQRIATGFHRNTMLNEEGGIDPLEFRFYAMTDRVATTGTVWLGLTVGCAQCHTHKFDPIPQREYYQFMACLDNADEPEMDVPQADIAARRAELEAKIAALEAGLPARFPAGEGEQKFNEWLKQEETRAVRWTPLQPVTAKSNLPLLTILEDGSVLSSGDQTKRDVYDVTYRTDLKGITAIRLDAIPDERLPKRGPGRIYYEGPFGDFFLSEVTLMSEGRIAPFARASQTFGTPAAAGIDGNPQTGWSINGGQGRPHSAVFNLIQPLDSPGEISLRLLFERYFPAGIGRFRVSAATDSRPAEARLPADIEALLLAPAAERTAEQRERLLRQFVSIAPELKAARDEINALRAQLPAFPTTLVMSERPADNPRPTHVHRRGEFLQPQEAVEPGTLSVLHPLPEGAPRNRLTFARWLVDPRNPLVGRVTVNRQWAALFGKGLVRTTEDFGFQGEAPSHPELLDYLAVTFREGVRSEVLGVRDGLPNTQHPTPNTPPWSTKSLIRLIVTSATYQQSARVTPELLVRDPQNRLLARAPRFRMEAELLRDTALTASGLLSSRIGGPSVFPPQPPGITSEGTYGPLEWKVSEGPDRYRRGLYTFTKRTAPYAMFTTFDAPSGEACVPRREVSNTPLQALTLLNDAVFVEAAQALGRLLAARPGSVEERVSYLFRRCLTRPPRDAERTLLVRYFETQRERCEKKELDAAAAAGPGDADVNERAAWTLLARSLLNLDEAVTR